MKTKTLLFLFLNLMVAGAQARAVEYDNDYSGDGQCCVRANIESRCLARAQYDAIERIQDQIKPSDYFYGCIRLSDYIFETQRLENHDRHEVCIHTKATASFHCSMSW